MKYGRAYVRIYTDGSCRDNEGGWSYAMFHKQHSKFGCGSEKDTTNNAMELTAVIEALKTLIVPCEVNLYCDSKYVLDGMNYMYGWAKKNWKTSEGKNVANRELWETLYNLVKESKHRIHKHWVRGHSGNINNETCDSLAKWARDNYEFVKSHDVQ